MDEEERRDRAREFLAEHSEVRQRLEKIIEDAVRESVELEEEEFTEEDLTELVGELVGELAEKQIMRLMANVAAIAGELFTSEEMERYYREEADRVMDPDTKLVSFDRLDQAISERMKEELQQHFPKYFPGQ
jgi:membrane-bound ClpP family serine protease